jgi:riboflavin biosynthesis pyrimidine reductase
MADVVLIGAGTLRGSSKHRWTAAHLQPRSAGRFDEWRAAMGIAPQPTTVVVTGSGDVPLDHPGLNDRSIPVVVATTDAGAARLAIRPVPGNVDVRPVGAGPSVTGQDLVGLLQGLDARLVLSEGGPHLLGELVASDLLDALFLTVAPQLVGRDEPGRLGLVEGLALPPSGGRWAELQSIHRSADHLFLRYGRALRPLHPKESGHA